MHSMINKTTHTNRTVSDNKSDIILRHNAERWCELIKVFLHKQNQTPDSQRSGQKAEIDRMWGVKTETILAIVGALEAMPHSMKRNLNRILMLIVIEQLFS